MNSLTLAVIPRVMQQHAAEGAEHQDDEVGHDSSAPFFHSLMTTSVRWSLWGIHYQRIHLDHCLSSLNAMPFMPSLIAFQ